MVPRIVAIVVTFNPDTSVLGEVLTAISTQVASTVVVDNSGTGVVAEWLQHRQFATPVELVVLAENIGLAGGQNRGIDWARRQGASHVLLLDQDSVPAAGMVDTLFAAWRRLVAKGNKVAAVGPRYIDPQSQQLAYFIRTGRLWRQRVRCSQTTGGELIRLDFLISSGTLIPMEVLDVVGTMDDKLFVDHVDTEWFLRAASIGYQPFGVCDAVMRHHLSEGRHRIWLGSWHELARYRPSRYYYIFRNSVILFRRDYVPARWMAAEIARLLGLFALHLLVSEQRWKRLSMMVRGFYDGVRGCVGKAHVA